MITRDSNHPYRQILLFTALPFGLMMGLFAGLFAGVQIGLIAGLLGGLIYGIGMSLILGGINQFSINRLNANYDERLLGVHQVQTLTLAQPFEEALKSCEAAVSQLPKCGVLSTDVEMGVIRAEVGTTWKSFGESVMLTASPLSDTECKVTISSKPKVSTTVVDYGKNAENMRVLLAALGPLTKTAGPALQSDPGKVPQIETATKIGLDSSSDVIEIKTNEESKISG